MCLAKLYQDEESAEPALESIAYLRLDGDQVELETLFGEKRVLKGRLQEIDFVRSRIVLEE
jgi:predicted RNA-binding protein